MDDGLTYSLEARARVALSVSAAQANAAAAALVPTYDEDGCPPGDLTEIATLLADHADETLVLAVAVERGRGASWERIAEVLGDDVTAVRERYEGRVARFQRDLVAAWLDPEKTARLPEGADDPAGHAARLDEWLTGDSRLDDPFRRHPDSEVRAHPVSVGLSVMSVSEHRELLASASRLIAGDDAVRTRRTEIGLHRRRIALLEWLLAEELNEPAVPGDLDEDALRTLLREARRRLARL